MAGRQSAPFEGDLKVQPVTRVLQVSPTLVITLLTLPYSWNLVGNLGSLVQLLGQAC